MIKRFDSIGLLVAVLAIGTACQAVPNDSEDVKEYTIEQFLKTTSYGGASFSPDHSKVLISSDETGVSNAYSVNITDGSKQQLTKSTVDSISTIDYFPSDERILYTADQGGNELNHIYVRLTDGSTKDLTPGENLKAQFGGWAHDRESFFIVTNERDQKFFDVYEYEVSDYSRKMIFKNDKGFFPGSISRDNKWIALSKINTRDDSNVFLYNREDETLKCITEHEGDINYTAQTFTPDSQAVLIATDKDSEFNYLMKYDLDSGNMEEVAKVDWDINNAFYSYTGKYFGYSFNEDGKTQYRFFESTSGKAVELPTVEGGSLAGINLSDDEKHMTMYASSGKMPRDLFYYQWGSDAPKQLTRSLNQEINSEHLVDGKVVRFNSFDGTEIPGILYVPQTATTENKAPALVWVHGGPGGQSRLGYRPLIQYLVNHGYVIYAINNRGSSGYGKTFQQMDDRKHGEGDLDDCVYSKKMLIETGLVDPERIGIIGGSYGGYMVCAALAFRPDEFDVGIDIFGVTNWHRTVQSIPPWWEAQRKALEKELGDFDDLEYFKKISPLFHADKIKKPLMVLQGANDPRVLKVESDEMVAAVKKNNVPVEYIVFDDEGHGFRKKKNQHRGYKAILEFCDKYLVKSETQ